jgi:uncharacterized membrane protein/mono/diheme cytochrome c family protein
MLTLRKALRLLILPLALLTTARSQDVGKEPPSSDEALQTTAAVFHLFEAKCNDCHGAHLVKPKGKLGYIMDLKRMAANEDFVSGTDPSKSELFRLVNEDEMPGKDSDQPPATDAEKLALRRWIQIGAPTQLSEKLSERQAKLMKPQIEGGTEGLLASNGGASDAQAVQVSPPDTNHGDEADGTKPTKPFWKKLLGWIGKFHAASTHFPIALLSVTLIAEMLGWWTKKDGWLTCTRFLLFIGAPSAVATASLGWLNEYAGVSTVYQLHKWVGTCTALWAVISLGCAVLFECREGTASRNRLRAVLVIGALLVSATGFLGGAVSFGLDHYKW